jgi:hypothetical protein
MRPGQEIWLSHHNVGGEKGLVSGGMHPRMNGDREGGVDVAKRVIVHHLILVRSQKQTAKGATRVSGIRSLTRLALQDGGAREISRPRELTGNTGVNSRWYRSPYARDDGCCHQGEALDRKETSTRLRQAQSEAFVESSSLAQSVAPAASPP